MSLIKDIKLQISAYDKLINKLVDENASDKLIGNMEMKRQKLIQRRNKLEKQDKQITKPEDGDKDKEIIMLKKRCEMLYDVAFVLLDIGYCPKCKCDISDEQVYVIDELAKDKYDNADLFDELNLL